MASTVSPAVSVADTVSARQPCKLPSSQASYLTQSQKLERAVSASTPILVPDTIDLQTPGEDPVREEQALAKKVRAAAEKHGVFLVTNHGIDKQLMQDLKAALRILFNMPKEEHAVLTMPPSAEVDRFLYGYTEVWGERIYSLQGLAAYSRPTAARGVLHRAVAYPPPRRLQAAQTSRPTRAKSLALPRARERTLSTTLRICGLCPVK